MNDQKIEQALNALHFKEAEALLQKQKDEKKDDNYWLMRSKAARGLYRLDEALLYAQKAKDKVEIAKCLFALGKVEEALHVLHSLKKNEGIKLVEASLLGEIGQVKKALMLLESINPEQLKPSVRVEYETLYADLLSFQEKIEPAFQHYQNALDFVSSCQADNWKPLRRMLIEHNMADVFEQIEEEKLAQLHYAKAKEQMVLQKQSDLLISDLSSYEIELLLSSANCFGNMEDFDQAHQDLHQAYSLWLQKPPFQKKYFEARIAYISGLIWMNEGKENEAIRAFEHAFSIQQVLVKQGLDKEEHLARSAYYLASLLDDPKEKLALYAISEPIFEQRVEKEPSFYLSCLADIENERGRLLDQSESYKKAIELYTQLLKKHPDDLLAKESRLIAMINLWQKGEKELEEAIQKELGELYEWDEDPYFLYSVCQYLEADGLAWIAEFQKKLKPAFDA